MLTNTFTRLVGIHIIDGTVEAQKMDRRRYERYRPLINLTVHADRLLRHPPASTTNPPLQWIEASAEPRPDESCHLRRFLDHLVRFTGQGRPN